MGFPAGVNWAVMLIFLRGTSIVNMVIDLKTAAHYHARFHQCCNASPESMHHGGVLPKSYQLKIYSTHPAPCFHVGVCNTLIAFLVYNALVVRYPFIV